MEIERLEAEMQANNAEVWGILEKVEKKARQEISAQDMLYYDGEPDVDTADFYELTNVERKIARSDKQ